MDTFCGNSYKEEITFTDIERDFFNVKNEALKKFRWDLSLIPTVLLSDNNQKFLEDWHFVFHFNNDRDIALFLLDSWNKVNYGFYRQDFSEIENMDIVERVMISFQDFRVIEEIFNYVKKFHSLSCSFAMVLTSDANKIHIQALMAGMYLLEKPTRVDFENESILKKWYEMIEEKRTRNLNNNQILTMTLPRESVGHQSAVDDEFNAIINDQQSVVDDNFDAILNEDSSLCDTFNISKYSSRLKDEQFCKRNVSTHIQNEDSPDYQTKLVTLNKMMQYVMISRDIDSIGVHHENIGDLLSALSENSVVKLYQHIGNIPTTSSRIAVKVKIGNDRKCVPLHRFPNICLGNIISNNIQFHLNFYCLKWSYNKKSYLPFSDQMRFVVALAFNLARMLQCNMLFVMQEEIDSNRHLFDQQQYRKLRSLIRLRKEEHKNCALDNSFWIGGGQLFFVSKDDANTHVLSATTSEAHPFFCDFMLSLQLLSLGVLSVPWFHSNCILSLNDKFAKSKQWCTYSLESTAQTLFHYRHFGLTAAGTKHSFMKYPSFVTLDNIFSNGCKDLDEEENLMDYQNWLRSSGQYYAEVLSKIFCDNHNVLMTIDDAINISPLQFEFMFLPVGNNESCLALKQNTGTSNDDVDDNEHLPEEDGDSDDSDYSYHSGDYDESISSGGNESESEISLSESDHNLIDEGDEFDVSDTCDENLQHQVDRVHLNRNKFYLVDDTLRTCNGFPASAVKRFPSLIPISDHEHSGHIPCEYTNGTVSFPERRFEQGLAGGGQKYLPITKGLTYCDTLKNVGKISNIDHKSFMIMQGYSHSLESHLREMDAIIDTLQLMDFSDNTSQDKLHRCSCVRLEGFRMFKNTNFADAFISFPFEVLPMPLLLVPKNCAILKYTKTLNTCIDILNNVFGKQSKLSDKSSLSIQAKMLVQFCAEIVSFELGHLSYPIRGPISNFFLDQGLFRNGLSLEFLKINQNSNNQNSQDVVKPLTPQDVETIGNGYNGIDPSIWNFDVVDHENLTETLAKIIPTLDLGTNVSTLGTTPRLDMNIIESTRSKLRAKLLSYNKNTIESNLSSWMILVSSAVTSGIRKARNLGNESTAQNAFDVIDSSSIANCIDHSPPIFFHVLEGIAELFLICYEWEYQSDLIGKRSGSQIPRTESELVKFSDTLKAHGINLVIQHLKTTGNHGKKRIKTIKELETAIFQVYTSESLPEKSSSWKTCIYLQLFKFIVNELHKAKQILPQQSQFSYVLTKDFFLVMIALVLMKNSNDIYSPPFVWHTTKNNRLKERGTYLGLDVEAMKTDIHKSMEEMKCMARNMSISVWHDGAVKDSWKEILRKEIKHRYISLYRILQSVPYPLNSDKGDFSFSALLIFRIAVMFLESKHLIVTKEIMMGANISEIWQTVSGIDTTASRIHNSIHALQESYIYTLWSQKPEFEICWKLFKRKILKMSTAEFDKMMKLTNENIVFGLNSNRSLSDIRNTRPPYIIDLQFVVELKCICLLICDISSPPSVHPNRSHLDRTKKLIDFKAIRTKICLLIEGFQTKCGRADS